MAAVSLCAVRLTPRSKLLTDRGDTPAASASSSWVSFAPARSRRSSPANVSAGCSATIAVPPHNLSARLPAPGGISPAPQQYAGPAVPAIPRHHKCAFILGDPGAATRPYRSLRPKAARNSHPGREPTPRSYHRDQGVRILVGCFVGCLVGGHAW